MAPRPNPLWLPGFDRSHPGESAGTWAGDDEDAPKIVGHTTEGENPEGAFSAYKANRSWPHLTVDPTRRDRWQHLALDVPARALRNRAGGAETNREPRVFQVEILGFASLSHLWPAAELDWLGAEVFGPLARATGTPLVSTVEFFGEGAGWILASESARQRLSVEAWDRYAGILGHQHVPENTHWDPGRLDVARIIAAAGGSTGGGAPVAPTETEKTLERIELRLMNVQAMLEGKPDNGGPGGKLRPSGASEGKLLGRVRDSLARQETELAELRTELAALKPSTS